MHHRRTLRPIQHNQLKELPGAISSENQVASRVFVDLLHDQRITQGVLDVLRPDTVAKR